jgi:hypothetical protein
MPFHSINTVFVRGPVMQPIPYGPLPRLALARISTYAVMVSAQPLAGERFADWVEKYLT